MEILPLECCVFLYSGLQTTIQSHTTNRAHKALGTFENAIMVMIKYVYQALHLGGPFVSHLRGVFLSSFSITVNTVALETLTWTGPR